MYQNEIEIIKSRIENKHQGDEKQLEIIFSPHYCPVKAGKSVFEIVET